MQLEAKQIHKTSVETKINESCTTKNRAAKTKPIKRPMRLRNSLKQSFQDH